MRHDRGTRSWRERAFWQFGSFHWITTRPGLLPFLGGGFGVQRQGVGGDDRSGRFKIARVFFARFSDDTEQRSCLKFKNRFWRENFSKSPVYEIFVDLRHTHLNDEIYLKFLWIFWSHRSETRIEIKFTLGISRPLAATLVATSTLYLTDVNPIFFEFSAKSLTFHS